MNISQLLIKLKTLVYSKSETDSLLGGKASSSHTHTKSQITDFPSLATVATSGSYSDLSNKPTIPTNTNQLTNGSGYLSGTVGIANGGTGATTRLEAVKNLTNENVGTSTQYFFTLTENWGKVGYASVANAKSVLGVPSIDLRPQASADANTVSDGVSITHYGSNGPSTSLGATANDGALFQQCWSSAWKVQIAVDYRNGNLFTRGKNNGTWTAWRAVAYHGDNVSKFTNDSGYITSSGSCNYATSAGNSDTLDGYHEYSFLRYRGKASTSGEDTLWAQIGIKDYNGALPDGLSGVYQWGEVVSLAGGNGRFDIYCSHNSSNGNGLYYRSGWANDKKAWRCFIDSGNIGSQSVNYANSAGSAGSVAWSNVTGKPSIPSIDLRPQANADANTVSDGVSITHYGSNGPSTSLGASANDGALFQQCWSSAWKVQIAADYRNGNLFTRGKNNGTWTAWRAVAYQDGTNGIAFGSYRVYVG